MKRKIKRSEIEEKIFKILMIVSLAIVLLSLIGIISVIVIKGFSALSWSMIFETPKGGYYLGKEGGIANAIVGSLYLAFGALILSLIVSIPLAFALQKDYLNKKIANLIRVLLDVLCGVPSIVYGAFAFIVMMHFMIRASLLGGIVTLALFMTPIMTRAMDESIRLVPAELKEASYSMGATRFETSFKIVLRQSLPGIATAVLIAFGRGIGDAASILFTAGYTDSIPTSLFSPVASLPLAIFFQIATPIAEVQRRAYASAFILLAIVLIVSIITRYLSSRFSRYNLS